jgi:hypothetical protein
LKASENKSINITVNNNRYRTFVSIFTVLLSYLGSNRLADVHPVDFRQARVFLAELLGTFVLVLLGDGSVAQVENSASQRLGETGKCKILF